MSVSYEHVGKYTTKSIFEKAINSLIGIIEGITIDSKINDQEVIFLQAWIDDHRIRADKHPFTELFPVLENALADNVVTSEEKEDILWLCKKLTSTQYFNQATADMQKLHAVLAAIAADGEISIDEMKGLSSWINEHDNLKGCWPYDEVESLITSVLRDKKIDEKEHALLLSFFAEFVSIMDNKTIVNPMFEVNKTIIGVCSVCPDISLQNSVFSFTGESYKYKRKEFASLITSLGCVFSNSVTKSVDYLLVGSEGNPNWAYACYGRKVERAVELRKQGHKIIIVHENDFHDVLQDM